MAHIAREALVRPLQRKSHVRVLEQRGVGLSPGTPAHQREFPSEMVGMTFFTSEFLTSEQEGMIAFVGLDLGIDLHVAAETTPCKPFSGMASLAGAQTCSTDRFGMRCGQRSRRWVTQGQIDGQQADHDGAEHQGSLGMRQDHGVPPMTHRSPNRMARAMWKATTASMTIASHR